MSIQIANSANATHDACASFDCKEQIVNDENKSRPIFSIRLICIFVVVVVSSDAASNKPIQKEELNKPNRFLNRTFFHLSLSLCVCVVCEFVFCRYAFCFFFFVYSFVCFTITPSAHNYGLYLDLIRFYAWQNLGNTKEIQRNRQARIIKALTAQLNIWLNSKLPSISFVFPIANS